ncbi:GNAT family N-acetyltransferase [Ochrobactrum teleogrylli]|uniref:GNAT family N-acetyltransferase n=1 Tax=Ochrobactrum teleogrylli TaxID=2479765 RepID=UPI00384E5361
MESPETPILIREVEVGDLPSIIDIDLRITGIAKPDLWYGKYTSDPHSRSTKPFLVAAHEGNIVGYVLGDIRDWEFGAPPSGWLVAIAVDPDKRLSRLGTQLFETLRRRFHSMGIRKMRTILHVDDDLLMSFFRSQGMMAGPFIELEMLAASTPGQVAVKP